MSHRPSMPASLAGPPSSSSSTSALAVPPPVAGPNGLMPNGWEPMLLAASTRAVIPGVSTNAVGKNYRVSHKIGMGSFGEIYMGVDIRTNERIAIKVENRTTKYPQLLDEYAVYRSVAKGIGVPTAIWCGSNTNVHIMVMDLLGESLETLYNTCLRKFSLKTVTMLAIQLLHRIEHHHNHHYLHRDIKPDNFLMGPPTSPNAHILYMVDMGLCKKFRDEANLTHIPYRENKKLIGTPRYASINTHLGIEQCRRDDLESIGYMLIYFIIGRLPWQGLKAKNKCFSPDTKLRRADGHAIEARNTSIGDRLIGSDGRPITVTAVEVVDNTTMHDDDDDDDDDDAVAEEIENKRVYELQLIDPNTGASTVTRSIAVTADHTMVLRLISGVTCTETIDIDGQRCVHINTPTLVNNIPAYATYAIIYEHCDDSGSYDTSERESLLQFARASLIASPITWHVSMRSYMDWLTSSPSLSSLSSSSSSSSSPSSSSSSSSSSNSSHPSLFPFFLPTPGPNNPLSYDSVHSFDIDDWTRLQFPTASLSMRRRQLVPGLAWYIGLCVVDGSKGSSSIMLSSKGDQSCMDVIMRLRLLSQQVSMLQGWTFNESSFNQMTLSSADSSSYLLSPGMSVNDRHGHVDVFAELLMATRMINTNDINMSLLSSAIHLRRAVFSGILDSSNNTAVDHGSITIACTHKSNALSLVHLARGLGFNCSSSIDIDAASSSIATDIPSSSSLTVTVGGIRSCDIDSASQSKHSSFASIDYRYGMAVAGWSERADRSYVVVTVDAPDHCLLADSLVVLHNCEKYDLISKSKINITVPELCKGAPKAFAVYLEYCRQLRFTQKPDYKYLRSLFYELFRSNGWKDDCIYDWMLPKGTLPESSPALARPIPPTPAPPTPAPPPPPPPVQAPQTPQQSPPPNQYSNISLNGPPPLTPAQVHAQAQVAISTAALQQAQAQVNALAQAQQSATTSAYNIQLQAHQNATHLAQQNNARTSALNQAAMSAHHQAMIYGRPTIEPTPLPLTPLPSFNFNRAMIVAPPTPATQTSTYPSPSSTPRGPTPVTTPLTSMHQHQALQQAQQKQQLQQQQMQKQQLQQQQQIQNITSTAAVALAAAAAAAASPSVANSTAKSSPSVVPFQDPIVLEAARRRITKLESDVTVQTQAVAEYKAAYDKGVTTITTQNRKIATLQAEVKALNEAVLTSNANAHTSAHALLVMQQQHQQVLQQHQQLQRDQQQQSHAGGGSSNGFYSSHLMSTPFRANAHASSSSSSSSQQQQLQQLQQQQHEPPIPLASAGSLKRRRSGAAGAAAAGPILPPMSEDCVLIEEEDEGNNIKRKLPRKT